ncbi:MAG: hypothetical protein ABWZ58_06835 [Acidimicrobiia bacterium]
MPFTKKGRHARQEIKSARPRWLSLLVALGLFAALMPMSAAFADSPDTYPWSEATNHPEWWEDVYGPTIHEPAETNWTCVKVDNDDEQSGGYTLGSPPEDSVWRLLVVKAGSDINDLFWDPVVGQTYEHSIQGGWSHVILCSIPDEANEPEGLFSVSKTAEASFDREHDWSIEKSVDTSVVNLFVNGSGDATVNWDIDVTYEGSTDSNHLVTGTITIVNGETLFDADIDDVVDDLGLPGFEDVDLDCDPEFPTTLAPGESMECTYSVSLTAEEAADGTNEVTVTGTLIDIEDETNTFTIGEEGIDGGGTAGFTFGDPTNEAHATVNVTDLSDLGDLLGLAYPDAADLELDAADYTAGDPENDTENFTYSYDFAHADFEECGEFVYDNTASVMSGEEVLDSDEESVTVNVQCLIFDGDTATGEGLPWKATKRAPNNWFMYTTWADIADGGADIIAGQFYDVGDVTGSQNGTTTLTFELDGDWELADVVGNVKINPMSCTTNQNYKQPGQFAYSTTVDPDDSGSFIVSGLPNAECYGIHLSVGQWVPDPNFPPAV